MVGRMKNPPHPGWMIKETIEDTGISMRELAERMDVSPAALSRLANGKATLTGEMAVKMAAVIGGSARVWMAMMADFQAAQAEKEVDVSNLKPLTPADFGRDTPAAHH